MIYKLELIQLGLNNMLYILVIGYVDRFKYLGFCIFIMNSIWENIILKLLI